MSISVFELDLSFEESVETAEILTKTPSGSLKAAIKARFLRDQEANPSIKGETPFKFSFSRSSERAASKILFVQAYKNPGSTRLFAKVVEKTFEPSKQPSGDGCWNSDVNVDQEMSFLDVGK